MHSSVAEQAQAGPRPPRLSDAYFLTRTFLFINKRLYRETTRRHAGSLRGTVVDVGCGDAPYRPLFTGATRYVAIDLEHGRAPDLVADAARLPVANGAADGVVCMEVLEHVRDPDAVVHELHRVLAARGTAFITVPMSWGLHYEPHDYRRFTSYGICDLVERHGFRVVECERIGGLFAVVGSRLVDGVASELYARLEFLPRRVRHALVLLYSIPMSAVFFALSRLFDRFERADAMGWAVVAAREPSPAELG